MYAARGCLLPGGGVSALRECLLLGGLLWGVSALGRSVCSQGGVCSRGMSAPGGMGGLLPGGCGIPACTEADAPL